MYRSKEWKRFRADLIRLEDGRCSRCRASNQLGAVLHAHHKFYVPGRKPWEYRYEDCEILCQSCHAQEHGKIPLKKDWEFIGYEDLGAPDGHCDYCGTAIRHVFMVWHQRWIALEVGEICCDNLTGTNAATNHMKERRHFLERKKRFVSKWVMDTHGAYVRSDDIDFRIVSADRAFKLRVNGTLGRLLFSTPLDAKIKAFEILESGEAARFLRKIRS